MVEFQTMRAFPRTVAALGLALLGALALGSLAGCKPSAESQAADREEIHSFLAEYLPKLAEAYRTGDTDPLALYAAAKERAAIEKRVLDLAKTGEVLAPKLQSFQIEDVTVWNVVNAYVTTVEVWDIRTYAAGSDNVLRQALGQRNRVKYQLRRDDGRWRVFWRQLEKTYDQSQ
jgi:hypothetical protein